jgi:hypothetical protein
VPVIINEFEVVVEAPTTPQPVLPRGAQPEPAPRAEDVAAVVGRQTWSRARLAAH